MKKTLKILASFILAGILLAELPEPKISGIDFYLINVETPRHFSFGEWNSRQHLFLRVKAELSAFLSRDATRGQQALEKLMIAKYIERIGDHAENNGEWVEFSVTGSYKGEELQ